MLLKIESIIRCCICSKYFPMYVMKKRNDAAESIIWDFMLNRQEKARSSHMAKKMQCTKMFGPDNHSNKDNSVRVFVKLSAIQNEPCRF